MDDRNPAQLDTAATIAAFLNFSVAHVRRMSRLQQMPVVKGGRRGVRFDRAEVLEAFAERANGTTQGTDKR